MPGLCNPVADRILLVEDEDSIRFAMEDYFVRIGYEVHCAEERHEAARLLHSHDFAALIVDLRLEEELDGLQVVRDGRRASPRAKILILTAYFSPEVEAEARRLGADALLQKPASLRHLAEIVRCSPNDSARRGRPMSPVDAPDVLIVDDSAEDAELTLRQLRRNGLGNRVHVLNDAAEAIDYILSRGTQRACDGVRRPQVVLLDLRMPKLGGVEALRRLRADERTRDLPVVMLTASHEDQDLRECFALGVRTYLVKPLDFQSFVRALSEIGLQSLVVGW